MPLAVTKLGASVSWSTIDVQKESFSHDEGQYASPKSHSMICNRRQNAPLRISSLDVNPKDLVGKVLIRVRKSPVHPSLTLEFSDNSKYQILVDSYDPAHPGIPKRLTTNMDALFNPPQGQIDVAHAITGCTVITLTDKAFEFKGTKYVQWDQNHACVAFKFEGDNAWHCVWVTMEEHDEKRGACIFRGYDDVYLAKLHRPARKKK